MRWACGDGVADWGSSGVEGGKKEREGWERINKLETGSTGHWSS